VAVGGTATQPDDPTRDVDDDNGGRYIFDGWYDQNGNAYTFDTRVTGNLTLTAQWTRMYTVTFDPNYAGAQATVVQVASGSTVSAPSVSRGDFTLAGWYTNSAGTGSSYAFTATPVTGNLTLYAKWYVSEATVDGYISSGIGAVNGVIGSRGSYAFLSGLGTGANNNQVTVSLYKWDTTVTSVYTDIVQTLLSVLGGYTDYVTTVSTNGTNLAIATADADAIKAFVDASSLNVSGSTQIGELDKKTLSVTVTTVTGDKYTYNVIFKKAVLESTIDSIISSGIGAVSAVIVNETNHSPNKYATLGDLGTGDNNNNVTVTITNGDVTVTSVYNDIINVLLDVLGKHTDVAYSLKTSDANKILVGAEDRNIVTFVKNSSLTDAENTADDHKVHGATKLSALYNQTLSVTVETTCGEEYTYNVTFVNGN
jgi:uncharacterized repeat protein (TIGR02543 family)